MPVMQFYVHCQIDRSHVEGEPSDQKMVKTLKERKKFANDDDEQTQGASEGAKDSSSRSSERTVVGSFNCVTNFLHFQLFTLMPLSFVFA